MVSAGTLYVHGDRFESCYANIKWFVTQRLRVPVFYTGSSGFKSLRANRRMNSSKAEQVLVKHKVESSNLSLSATYGGFDRDGKVLVC